MTLHAGTSPTGTSARRAGRTPGLRRASLAALILLLIQYGIGIGVNLYVSVPAADHGRTISTAISSGPGALTVHIVLGLLLILAAAALVVQAIMARHPGVIATSVIGLLALVGAAAQGAAFVDQAHPSASIPDS
jgi:heme A synthase